MTTPWRKQVNHQVYPLAEAETIAQRVVAALNPYCTRIEIAGSIRRRRPQVHDIDIVAEPSNQGQFVAALQTLGRIGMGGSKLIRVQMAEISLDVYVATPAIWATLLLIRTGSAQHNIRLCTLARDKGMRLHADGTGLLRGDERVAGDSEQSIFETLGLPYKRPEERE